MCQSAPCKHPELEISSSVWFYGGQLKEAHSLYVLYN
jgi:hypothetical protein